MPTKSSVSKTGFDKFFDEQMKSPSFARSYAKARAEIDAIDSILRALDEARVKCGMSKAELARTISARPEIVRRLLTDEAPNPTLATIVRLASALGYRLELVRHEKQTKPLRRKVRANKADKVESIPEERQAKPPRRKAREAPRRGMSGQDAARLA